MPTRTVLALLLTAQFLLACSGSSSSDETATAEYQEAKFTSMDSEEGQQPSGQAELPDKKIIRTANLRMEVADYQGSLIEIKALTETYEAEITAEEEQQYGQRLENRLTIRLAPERLDEMLEALAGLALAIDNRSVSSEDVTRQYVDLEARMAAKRDVLERYRALLKEAKNVQEVLAVERELRQIIEEIESTEAQLRYLKQQVGRSTINLSFYEKSRTGIAQRSFGQHLADAFGNGWDLLKSMALGLISAWPVVLVIALLLTWWVRRRRK